MTQDTPFRYSSDTDTDTYRIPVVPVTLRPYYRATGGVLTCCELSE